MTLKFFLINSLLIFPTRLYVIQETQWLVLNLCWPVKTMPQALPPISDLTSCDGQRWQKPSVSLTPMTVPIKGSSDGFLAGSPPLRRVRLFFISNYTCSTYYSIPVSPLYATAASSHNTLHTSCYQMSSNAGIFASRQGLSWPLSEAHSFCCPLYLTSPVSSNQLGQICVPLLTAGQVASEKGLMGHWPIPSLAALGIFPRTQN